MMVFRHKEHKNIFVFFVPFATGIYASLRLTLKGQNGATNGLSFSSDNKRRVSTSDGSVVVWNTGHLECEKSEYLSYFPKKQSIYIQ
jgi:hypothetical protein